MKTCFTSFSITVLASFVLLSGCQKAIEDAAKIKQFESGDTPGSMEISITSKPAAASPIYKSCLKAANVILAGEPLNVVDKLLQRDRIQIELTSKNERNILSCIFEDNAEISLAIFNGSKMPKTVLPLAALNVGDYKSITNLPHRAFTKPMTDNGIIKFYSQFDVLASPPGEYCLEYTYRAENDSKNSIFVDVNGSDFQAISLPVTGSEIGKYLIESPRLKAAKGGAKYPVRIKHRENVTSFGVRFILCS